MKGIKNRAPAFPAQPNATPARLAVALGRCPEVKVPAGPKAVFLLAGVSLAATGRTSSSIPR